HHQKNAEGDDQEIDQNGDKIAVGEYWNSGFFRRIQRHSRLDLVRERDVIIGEVQVAENSSQRRHEKVFHNGSDNFSKGSADNDTYRQVNGVTFDRELFEFFPHKTLK